MNIGIADFIFLALLLFFVIRTTVCGFIAEFFSKAAVIVGALVAVLFYKLFTPVISRLVGEQAFAPAIAFLILFLATYLVIKLVQLFLGSLFENDSLQSLDRALGFFLGIIEGLLIIIVILIVLNLQPVFDTTAFLSESFFANFLSPFIIELSYFQTPASLYNGL